MKVTGTGPFGVNTLTVPLCDGYVFIVDPACCEYCGDEDVITDWLKDNSLIPAAVILTHGHFDHVAGLKSLRKSYPDIPVLIHREDSDMIGPDSRILQSKDLSLMGFFDFIPSVSDLPAADGFLEDGKTPADSFNFNLPEKVIASIAEWKVIHTPGHTKGSVCLYNDRQKLLISGDTLFYMSWGRTDLTGGSETEMRSSLRRLRECISPDALVYPGHDRFAFKMSENY